MRSLLPPVAIVASLLASPALAQKIDLRPKFEKGQEIRLKMELGSTSKIELPGNSVSQPQSQEMSQELTLLLKVKEADPEKGATVDLVYEALKLHVAAGAGVLDFDSTQPPDKDNKLVGDALRGMIGSTMTVQFAPDGSITSVSDGEALGSAAMFGISKPAPGRSLFGPIGTIKKGSGEVSVGESWQNVDQLDLFTLGKFKSTMDHKLESLNAGNALVKVNGKLEPDTEAAAALPVKLLSGSSSGSYKWDTGAGFLDSMDVRQDVAMELDKGGTKSQVTSVLTTKVTRVK